MNAMSKVKEQSLKERRAEYVKKREYAVSVLRRIERDYGHMGVMAVFQHWFMKPLRGRFDWYSQ